MHLKAACLAARPVRFNVFKPSPFRALYVYMAEALSLTGSGRSAYSVSAQWTIIRNGTLAPLILV
jgi:hypothetical protein